jgi:hypothetical protein
MTQCLSQAQQERPTRLTWLPMEVRCNTYQMGDTSMPTTTMKKATKKLPASHRHRCIGHKDEWICSDAKCNRALNKLCNDCKEEARAKLREADKPTEEMPAVEVHTTMAAESHDEPDAEVIALVDAAAEQGKRAGKQRAAELKVEQEAAEALRINHESSEATKEITEPVSESTQTESPTVTMHVKIEKSRKTPGMHVGYLMIVTPTQRYHRLMCHEVPSIEEVREVTERKRAEFIAAGEVPQKFTAKQAAKV